MRRYTSAKEYQDNAKARAAAKGTGPQSPNSKSAENAAPESAKKVEQLPEASNVQLSEEARSLAQAQTPETSVPSAPLPSLPGPKAPTLPERAVNAVADQQIAKAAQIPAAVLAKDGPIQKPAIFFFKGHAFEGEGIEEMANSYPGGEQFSYDDASKAIEQILKRPVSQPVVLVGHGMGGDTAIEVAKELNKPEHGFRMVQLLVSLDALGFNNDVIPQNVLKSVNYLGNQESFFGLFNDGPKVAKNAENTQVENYLRPEGHTEIDESEEIQFKVFQLIRRAVGGGTLAKTNTEPGPGTPVENQSSVRQSSKDLSE